MSAKKIVVREPMEVYKIVGRVNRDGLEKTAQALGTHKSTLSRWLDTQGYVMVRTWEDAKVLEMKRKVKNEHA